MWKNIFNHINTAGLNPHAPGQHQGECKNNFCIAVSPVFVPLFILK